MRNFLVECWRCTDFLFHVERAKNEVLQKRFLKESYDQDTVSNVASSLSLISIVWRRWPAYNHTIVCKFCLWFFVWQAPFMRLPAQSLEDSPLSWQEIGIDLDSAYAFNFSKRPRVKGARITQNWLCAEHPAGRHELQ